MAKTKYQTAPVPSKKMPKGIPYIIGNEAAERFSFYGMRTILMIFMTKYLVDSNGGFAGMSDEKAKVWFHLFVSSVYFTPIIGALISDIFFGKYKTILFLSIVYCLGHLALALDETQLGLTLGLTLIAIGSGGIKPCVSAHVGDQFGKTNQHLMPKVFSWFYFSINFGSMISTLLTPVLLDRYGPSVAFGLPGFMMFLATFVFWLGRRKFVHIPAAGMGFVKESLNKEGLKIILRLGIIFVCVAPFWSLFDQTGSAWVLQAEKMDRNWLGVQWLSSQIQAVNPCLVMILIPVFSYGIYPAINRIFKISPLRKISIGLFVAAGSFVVSAYIESQINGGDVFKYSSRTKIESLSPLRLIDGESGTIGWSSNKAPTASAPGELVIRLRERHPWTISRIEIDPSTILIDEEIVMLLDDLVMRTLRKSREVKESSDDPEGTQTDALMRKADLLEEAAKNAKKSAREAGKASDLKDAAPAARIIAGAAAARAIAIQAYNETNEDTRLLESRLYFPKEVSIYAADFSDKPIPLLFHEIVAQKKELQDLLEEKQDKKLNERNRIKYTEQLRKLELHPEIPKQYYQENQWIDLGQIRFSEDGSLGELEFNPVKATHVLVLINSNYGANRVKISEIRVETSEALPEESEDTAGSIWPNVAALGYQPNIFWQILAYIILTAAEVMVSITCLEFAYTQSPRKMKSFIMSLFLLSISLGNLFVAAVNFFIQNDDGTNKFPGANYYWFWTITMLVTAVIFVFVAASCRVQNFVQEETSEPSKADS